MKKYLSIVLAAIMLLTLVPFSAFSVSANDYSLIIDGIDRIVNNNDLVICTSLDSWAVCNPNWSMNAQLTPCGNGYKVVAVSACPWELVLAAMAGDVVEASGFTSAVGDLYVIAHNENTSADEWKLKEGMYVSISALQTGATITFSSEEPSSDNEATPDEAEPIPENAKFEMNVSAPETYTPNGRIEITVTVDSITAENGLQWVECILTYDNSRLTPVRNPEFEESVANNVFQGFAEWNEMSQLVTLENGDTAINLRAGTAGSADGVFTSAKNDGDITFVVPFVVNGNATGNLSFGIKHSTVEGGYIDLETSAIFEYVGAGSNATVICDASAMSTEGLEYTLNSDGESYSVTGYNGSSPNVVVPSYYNGLPVTAIGESAFNMTDIISVKICENVEDIQEAAFLSCDYLESVYIPASVKSIGSSALASGSNVIFTLNANNEVYYCENNCIVEKETKTLVVATTNRLLPEGIKAIGSSAFSFVGNKKIVIPDTVTTIGFSAFEYCINLTEVVIPDSVEVIEGSAFAGCFKLKELNIPASVKSLGNGLFNNCFDLAELSVDSENPVYYSENNCIVESATKKLVATANKSVIPSDIKIIGSYAIDSRNFTELVIPEGVTTLEYAAIFSCSSLKKLTIPASVTKMSYDSVMASFNLSDIYCGVTSKPSGWHKNWLNSAGTVHWAEVVEEYTLGDVNDSGAIDMMDYILLKRNYFGTFDFDEEQLKRGDCNKSGAIDMMDYILLKRAYFGTFTL